MSNLLYKRISLDEPVKPKPSQDVLDFIRYYGQIKPEFISMFGNLIDFYCYETDSFQISEVNSEYQYFIKK